MKTEIIRKVSYITKGKTPVVILVTRGSRPDIVRTPKEFLTDLNQCNFIDEEEMSMRHPKVKRLLRNLRNAELEGEITYHKKGELWTVTKNSAVITNKNHKDYGKYEVGDRKEYESDTAVVDGFLDFYLADDVQQRIDNAEAYAAAKASTSDFFDTVGAATNADEEEPQPDFNDEHEEEDEEEDETVSKAAKNAAVGAEQD